jgi:hypothetical protein
METLGPFIGYGGLVLMGFGLVTYLKAKGLKRGSRSVARADEPGMVIFLFGLILLFIAVVTGTF